MSTLELKGRLCGLSTGDYTDEEPSYWSNEDVSWWGVNYDFGYWDEKKQKVYHASNKVYPSNPKSTQYDPDDMGDPKKPMMVYQDDIEDWYESNLDFDGEVWCFACSGGSYGKPPWYRRIF